jgi:alpha-glutamyl/putrescinyl thymine pyrophosphorylase clade 1
LTGTVRTDIADCLRRSISIAGRVLDPTPVFETYWRFAAERQRAYQRRLAGCPPPWTDDPVIRQHRFTNAYRAADRVSQYLIRNVIYTGSNDADEVLFRILLFKFFNRIETWQLLCSEVGTPTWSGFDFASYEGVLSRARARNAVLYSPAYVVPPPQLGESTKAANHLRLVATMMRDSLTERVVGARSLRDLYDELVVYPSIGRFIGFQLTVDVNYSEVVSFSEMEFVAPGPGAVDGVRKCFGAASTGIEQEVIRYVADSQEHYFADLELKFEGLFGRPLQLIDCQNLFCEVDKYARVVHPEVAGVSGRSRIKQRYRPRGDELTAWFPPKWGLVGSNGHHHTAPGLA